MKKYFSVALTIALVLSGYSCGGKAPELKVTAADVAANNRGVALMGYFDYGGARDTFDALVANQPGWLDARINLAIATLNRQEENDEATAMEIVQAVLKEDPANLRAHYISGILSQNKGDIAAAEKHFRVVAEADSSDGYAAYFLGQTLNQLGNGDEALRQYRRAIELDPYLRSAYYGAALSLRQAGSADEAAALLETYKRFEGNPRARLAELKYTKMGPKATALAIDLQDRPAPLPLAGAVFEQDTPVAQLAALSPLSTMTTVDIDADGDQDLFVTRVGAEGRNVVLLNDRGEFAVTPHPLSDIDLVNAVAWGDFDNDGQLAVYLCRSGPNQMWQQTGQAWVDVSASTQTANDDAICSDVIAVDADHDGDLDLFLTNRDAANELFSNNLDGTFRPLAADYGIGGRFPSVAAISGDLDNDRDVDLMVINADAPHDIFINDRLWQYRSAPDAELSKTPVVTATLADSDADGRLDLFAMQADGRVYRQAGLHDLAFGSAEALALPADGPAENPQIGVTDFDGDGHLDVLRVNACRWEVYSLVREAVLGKGDGCMVLPIAVTPGKGPDLLVATRDGLIRHYAAGPGRFEFLTLQFSGKEEKADSMRSNRDGLGTHVELRVGSRWTIVDTLDRLSSPGQSLQPLMLGLGGADKADFVALTWSDGVFQTELGLAAGSMQRIEETQRQLSSCPVLFAWDGEQFSFVTDVLGVGGLGFFVEPGVVATPRPWEFLLLPDGLLAQRDGELVLKLSEPMEELAYIDSVQLHAYDLPAGLSMVMDDRMVIEGPAATGEPLFFDRLTLPLQALDGSGKDVTRLVREADLRAMPPGPVDPRFIGRLAGSSVITLDFPWPVDQQSGTPILLIDGWIEYPYSQTVFAAWQADEHFLAPTLEAFGGDGHWHTVHARFGYPAGMPRQMALPLSDLPKGTMRLRLSTNQEIYWDRIAIAHSLAVQPDHQVIKPNSATQQHIGFPRRTNKAQRVPEYDYSVRDKSWDTRYLPGYYSAFGAVEELISQTDDAVAIIGPGEEIEFSFVSPKAPAPGLVRHYVLEIRGWAKDMDMYTRNGESVGPLPLRDPAAVSSKQRDDLHTRYHTRYEGGR